MPQERGSGLSETNAPWQVADTAGAAGSALVRDARHHLEALQQPDGHWVFELEADATIPADYVFLEHFLDEIDQELQERMAAYLRAGQAAHGGWSLFAGGDFDLSASVRAYFALKLVGDDPEAPHMRRAREGILTRGGAARANVFTRIHLALFGQVPWRAVPVMPVELMLLPSWSPFHLDKVSYWSRVTIVPLTLLMALKPRARNPRGVRIDELFVVPPEIERGYVTNPDRLAVGQLLPGCGSGLAGGRAPPAQGAAPAGDREGGRLRHRAAERRGWPRRHLPADGQHGHGLRCAGLCPGPSGLSDRDAGGAKAGHRARRHRLCAALSLADLGHGADLPCVDGEWRAGQRRAGTPRSRLAGRAPDHGHRR